MSSGSEPPQTGNKNGMLRVFRGLQWRSKLTDRSAQDSLQESGNGRPKLLEGRQLQGAGRQHPPSPSPRPSPAPPLEDRLSSHHGNIYNSSHSTHGTRNHIGTATHATLGANSVTTIEQAFLSQGNGQFDNVASWRSRPEAPPEATLLWDSLPRQRDISGKQNEYLEGSREETVQDVLGWGKDPKSELSFFIYGAAGLGKSTLARHLTHRLHAAGLLAASVSLNALPSDARGPESVVKMVSREIGETYPNAIPSILEAIKSCKGAPLVDHIERYMVEPARSLGLPNPLIVLFDAIDEWESHPALLKALSSLTSSSIPVKFILLGRSDPRARGFKDVSIRPYPLQPVPTAIMVQYLAKQFDDVNWEHGRCPAPWRITQLAELANGLFIWVTVVCSLLQKRLSRSSPEDILASILAARRSLGDSEQLATLYHQAIMWLFPDHEGRDLFREYLSGTLALCEPLPIADFAGLTNLPIRAIHGLQVDLKALQIRQVGDGDGDPTVYPAGRLFHQSFIDYLESASTPSHIAFRIPLLEAHNQLAQCCLTLLPHFLHSTQQSDPPNLSSQHRYAAKYLATHIHRGTPSVRPGSALGWERTRICKLLQQAGNKFLYRWGSLLVCLANPAFTTSKGDYGDDNMGRFMQYIADALGSDPENKLFQISWLEVAVRLQPEDAEAWRGLGWAYWKAAEHSKDFDAGEMAVLAHQNALDIVEESGSSDRASALFSLATSLHTRFQLMGNTEDLDSSISLHRKALALRPPGHADRADSLGNLAVSLKSSSKPGGLINNVDKIMHLEREALDLCPPGHADHSICLLNLANTLHSRFQTTASLADVEEAVQLRRKALELCPPGHPVHAKALQSLAASLQSRSETTASTADLDEAVQLDREALELCPPEHADRLTALQNLAASLQSHSQTTASTTNLDEAVQLCREALELCPLGHADRAKALQNLVTSLHSRSRMTASTTDLDETVHLCREALELCPPGHPERAKTLQGLAASLHSHSQMTASTTDLDETVQLCRETLELCPPRHADHTKALQCLAASLQSRSKMTASTADLDEAVQLRRVVLELRPLRHAGCVAALRSLARSLQSRFETTASTVDLDEAVQLHREVLELCPPGHPDRAAALRDLAYCLHSSFEMRASVADIEESISMAREALGLCPTGHLQRGRSLNNLAWYLLLRYEARGGRHDLEESISLSRESVALSPTGHQNHPYAVGALAMALRFQPNDLDGALRLRRESTVLVSSTHPRRWEFLMDLATILHCHYEHSCAPDKLEEAVSVFKEALSLCPPNHFLRLKLLRLQAKLAEAQSFSPHP